MAAAESVHVFFNTNYGSQGPRNAARLMDLLGIAHPPLPEGDEPRQQRLL